MKRFVFSAYCLVLSVVYMNSYAVPAHPGARTRMLPDGTQQTYYVHGDEFYHWETTTPKATLTEEQQVRRAAALQRAPHRMPAEIGEPYLPQKGLVILVNFKDVKFRSENTRDQIDSLCNGLKYTYNGAYKSAAQYFKDQSNGQYCPKFDVVGPVELDSCYAYYGKNNGDNDRYIADLVIESCRRANAQYPALNFADYARHKSGEVDFVFIFYAGYGENETYNDDPDRVWPAQWTVNDAFSYYSSGRFTRDSAQIDGVKINMFAYTNELNYLGDKKDTRCGIGTLCHEFGHVLGLADLYNSTYSKNIPQCWHIMCTGCYNDNGNRPPSYSPFDKFFFGWAMPTLLQDTQEVRLPADGKTYAYMTENNTAWSSATQFNDSTVYYFENRQQTGWDAKSANLNGHGLIVWKVNFNKNVWKNNNPNNDQNALRYTIIPSSGSSIVGSNNDDTYPGNKGVTSFAPFTHRPLISIEENEGVITLITQGEKPTDDLTLTPDYRSRRSNLPYSPTPKIIRNGRILIEYNNQTYDILGNAQHK